LKNIYLRDHSFSRVGETSPGQWETFMEGTCLRGGIREGRKNEEKK
jgi:hypothetical protein